MREAKEEISKEKREMEQKAANIVVYDAKESVKEERRKDDAGLVKEMAEAMGVEIKGDMEVKFRAGKKSEEGRPRPMIVKVEDEETREHYSPNLSRKWHMPSQYHSICCTHFHAPLTLTIQIHN